MSKVTGIISSARCECIEGCGAEWALESGGALGSSNASADLTTSETASILCDGSWVYLRHDRHIRSVKTDVLRNCSYHASDKYDKLMGLAGSRPPLASC